MLKLTKIQRSLKRNSRNLKKGENNSTQGLNKLAYLKKV